jgi:hypothetical protein
MEEVQLSPEGVTAVDRRHHPGAERLAHAPVGMQGRAEELASGRGT